MIGCFALGYFTFIIDPYAKNARVGARLTNHIYAREEAVENSPIWYRFECQFHISNNALLDRTTRTHIEGSKSPPRRLAVGYLSK